MTASGDPGVIFLVMFAGLVILAMVCPLVAALLLCRESKAKQPRVRGKKIERPVAVRTTRPTVKHLITTDVVN